MLNYTNPKYSGSPSIPIGTGDRHYAQDLLRDIRYMQDQIGLMYKRLFGSNNMIIEGMIASQGTGHTLNITAGKAVGLFNVTIPHRTNTWVIPPDVETEDINTIIPLESNIVDMAITSAVTDGITLNYIKLAYNELDGNTRAKAKKSGSYSYEVMPNYVITVDSVAPTGYEVVIDTFTSNGTTLTFKRSGDRTIYYGVNSAYDIIIDSQASFNSIIERVGANQYKIKDDIKSVYFKTPSSGYYSVAGVESPLSNGDSWGYLQTNNCIKLEFQAGCYLYAGDTQFYLEVNTNYCEVKKCYIKGLGTTPSAILYSYHITGYYTRLISCLTSDRITSNNFISFDANNGTEAQKYTRYFYDCHTFNMKSNGTGSAYLTGFMYCYNSNNCSIVNFQNQTDYSCGVDGFVHCDNSYNLTIDTVEAYYCYLVYGDKISNIKISNIIVHTSGDLVSGKNLNDVYLYNITNDNTGSGADYLTGISQVVGGSGFYIDTISCNGSIVYAINDIQGVSGIKVVNVDGLSAGDNAYGVYNAVGCSGIYITTIDGVGNAYGMSNSKACSGVYITDIDSSGGTAYGFYGCSYLAAVWTDEPNNASNDWIDTVDTSITNKVSTPSIWT